MSFLGGRLAGIEGAYFLQESKHAVGRLLEKKKNSNKLLLPNPNSPSSTTSSSSSSSCLEDPVAQSEVLPEVLRHSLPSKIFQPAPDSSISTSPKWVVPSGPKNVSSSLSPDVLNPLRAYASVPKDVTFGPKRCVLSPSLIFFSVWLLRKCFKIENRKLSML